MGLFDGKPLDEADTPTLSGSMDDAPKRMKQKALINTEAGGYRGCLHEYEVLEHEEKRIVRRCLKCSRRQTIRL